MLSGQQLNLVRNYSFEDYSNCPVVQGDYTGYILDWTNANDISPINNTPDYLNACNTNLGPMSSYMGVPYNNTGYQEAYNGQAYTGLYTLLWNDYHGYTNFREYTQSILFAPLISSSPGYSLLGGIPYKISMRVNASNNSAWGTLGPQIGLDNTALSYSIPYNTPYIANVPIAAYSSSPIGDTLNWTEVKADTFYTMGDEEYIIIGSFFDDTYTIDPSNIIIIDTNSTYYGSRISYYFVDDVWVSPLVIVWQDTTICEGDSVLLTAYPSSSFDYEWSSGPFDDSYMGHEYDSVIMVSPDVTTEYMVVITDSYLNTDTGFVTVTVNPMPQEAILTGPLTKCEMLSLYTVENFDSVYLYSWSIDDLNYNALTTDTFTVDWSVNIFDSYLYLMTTDTATGCNRKDSLLVYACCGDSLSSLWADTSLVFNDTIYGQTIIVIGTVDISGFLFLDHCNLLMNPNAKIIINPSCTLKMNKDSVLPCGYNYMWDGIYISDNSAKLDAIGVCYLGGQNAVVSLNGGEFVFYDCDFVDNHIGIHVKPYAQTHTGSIKNSLFKCTALANMLPPYDSLRSHAGIVVDTVLSIQIGGTAYQTDRNEFDFLDYGIKVESSNVSVYNNTFENLTQTQLPFAPISGFAIYSNNATSGSKTLNVGSYLSGGYYSNDIADCQTGIYIDNNQHINIIGNNMSYMGFGGVYFESCTANNITIDGNYIRGGLYGIYGRYFRRFAVVNVLNNECIEQSVNAISIENDILALAQVHVQDNQITHPGFAGIQLTNINNKSWIENNVINFSLSNVDMTTNRYGILVQNCPKDSMIYNVVTNANTITAYPAYFHGIAVQTSTEVYMLCNDVTKVGYGVSFTGYCNNSKIILNDMTACYSGIRLESATIGTQGTLAQPWDNRWYTSAGPYRIAGSPSIMTTWYYRNSSNAFLITPYSVSPNNINPYIVNTGTFSPCSIFMFANYLENYQNSVSLSDTISEYFEALYKLRKIGEPSSQVNGMPYVSTDLINIEVTRNAIEDNADLPFLDHSYPNDNYGDAHKVTYGILIENIKDYMLTSADSNKLMPIAYANPLQFGEAVYSARVLLGIHSIPELKLKDTELYTSEYNVKLLEIFPNPTSEIVNMIFPFIAVWEVQISTIDGKTLIEFCNNNEPLELLSIDVSKLDEGNYIVTARESLSGNIYSGVISKQ